MIQYKDCKLFVDGNLTCDPTSNIKEPECLMRWALLKLANIEELLLRNDKRTESTMHQINNMLAAGKEADDWKRGTHEEET